MFKSAEAAFRLVGEQWFSFSYAATAASTILWFVFYHIRRRRREDRERMSMILLPPDEEVFEFVRPEGSHTFKSGSIC